MDTQPDTHGEGEPASLSGVGLLFVLWTIQNAGLHQRTSHGEETLESQVTDAHSRRTINSFSLGHPYVVTFLCEAGFSLFPLSTSLFLSLSLFVFFVSPVTSRPATLFFPLKLKCRLLRWKFRLAADVRPSLLAVRKPRPRRRVPCPSLQ